MTEDIRDRPTIDHADVMALNFVNAAAPVVFRRHFRQGLRSHVLEILDPQAVAVERKGTMVDGVMRFPKAEPRRMLRIFRTRLHTLDEALDEIGRVKIVERFLAPDCMATSVECIVDYRGPDGWHPVLCGFQEYVPGQTLDPWTILDQTTLLSSLYDQFVAKEDGIALSKRLWVSVVRQKTRRFVDRIKCMIAEAGHIPDLAGVGNLIVTTEGDIRLVDINNISRIGFEASIPLDEKGYPVCDKSVEALALIEAKVLGSAVDLQSKLFRHYLEPGRKKAVNDHEVRFWKQRSDGG